MGNVEINPAELSVDIGFPTGNTLPWQTCMSLAKTVKACTQRRVDVGVACIAGSSVVTWARDKVLDTFLEGTANYLFWIDSDIVWQPADFIRTLVLSSKFGVVCATYAQKNESQTIVIKRNSVTQFDINPHGLIKVDGAGLGFTCVPRTIVEQLAETKPLVFDPVEDRSLRAVFRLDTVEKDGTLRVRHEDTNFFADIRELGHDVYLDPTIKLGHVGTREYKNDPLQALRLKEAFNQELQVA